LASATRQVDIESSLNPSIVPILPRPSARVQL
jgi:hypothetical protein